MTTTRHIGAVHSSDAEETSMATDAFEMAMVHRVFRTELHNAAGLVRDTEPGDIKRSALVSAHLTFMADALHHHHLAEDELVWPKLHERAPSLGADATRMERQHNGIARAVDTVRAIAPRWRGSAEREVTDELASAVDALSALVDEHLADEEANAVPLINEHLTPKEWQQAIDRGAAFLWKHPKLGLVLGGFVLAEASPDEQVRFLAGVPLPQRTLMRLFGHRAYASYCMPLYGQSKNHL
jgi:iron-sulfur cluster repair protein YtfE (RIC family)